MSLLEKAKKAAKAADDQLAKDKANEISAAKYFKDSLEKISKDVLAGLKEFNNVKTPKGTLKLVKKRNPNDKTIANLRLVKRPYDQEDLDLLFIDAAIESGVRDYADDARDIPYKEAVVSIYVKNPPTTDTFSYAPTCNGPVKALGLTTFFGEYIHNWNEKELPQSLEKVADWLVPLFRET